MLTPPNRCIYVALCINRATYCFDGYRADPAPQSPGPVVYLWRKSQHKGQPNHSGCRLATRLPCVYDPNGLAIFRRLRDRLIPLYAVGAFMALTLSRPARKSMFLNGLGAIATAISVAVVLVAKFTEGA
jgi:hypothetical protein